MIGETRVKARVDDGGFPGEGKVIDVRVFGAFLSSGYMVFGLRLREVQVDLVCKCDSLGDVSVEIAAEKDLDVAMVLFDRGNQLLQPVV